MIETLQLISLQCSFQTKIILGETVPRKLGESQPSCPLKKLLEENIDRSKLTANILLHKYALRKNAHQP